MLDVAELMAVAAGSAAMSATGRLAGVVRRCRQGQAPWMPAIVGAVLGYLAYALAADKFIAVQGKRSGGTTGERG